MIKLFKLKNILWMNSIFWFKNSSPLYAKWLIWKIEMKKLLAKE